MANIGMPMHDPKLSREHTTSPLEEYVAKAALAVWSDIVSLDVDQIFVLPSLLLVTQYCSNWSLYRNLLHVIVSECNSTKEFCSFWSAGNYLLEQIAET